MAVNENTLVEAAVEIGMIEAGRLRELRLLAKRERLRLVEVVTREGRFPETALYQALSDVRQMPFFQLGELAAEEEIVRQIPRNLRSQRLMLPVKRDGELYLVLGDPDDRLSVDRVERATGLRFKKAMADPEALRTVILRSGDSPGAGMDVEEIDPVQLLNEIMKEVYLRRATDVHLEPAVDGLRIRFRVDGEMQEYHRALDKEDEEGLVNRVKVLSGLDIAEQRMAQDGAMKYTIIDWTIPELDIRVATIPTRWGERVTMRILGQDSEDLSLEQLGMPEDILADFRAGINRPHGMILVTGPTGSGKSTTLYAGIRELKVDEMNVLTVEDPVEQTVDGVSQVQVSTKVSFAQALRSFLRHDPDVILVGEIRDQETVEIGLRAAMTGHLVLSTLHTNDSVGAVTRLQDIGAERFLVGSTLIGVLAQRLVRRLCRKCRKPKIAAPDELEILGLEPDAEIEIYEPGGCSFCLGSGFKGRLGVFEALWVTRALQTAIADGAGENEIRQKATSLKTLWQDGCEKVIGGEVSLAEILHLRTLD